MKVFIDIETIPTQNNTIKQQIMDGITAPGQYKKQESIEKWMAENKEQAFNDAYRKTALSGINGEIIAISYAVEDSEPANLYRKLEGLESVLLTDFYNEIKKSLTDDNNQERSPLWVGHNIADFDLRFLWQRSVLNGVKPLVNLRHNDNPWSPHLIDTLYEWSGKNKAGGSLDKISKAMGFKGKGDITGANVWDYVLSGKEEEVSLYCGEDVSLTREIYKRMFFI